MDSPSVRCGWKGEVVNVRRTVSLTLLSVALFVGALASPAQAQEVAQAPEAQDGLIHVTFGDVTIMTDVNISDLAAQVAGTFCGVRVGPVAVLGSAGQRDAACR
jgi:hypothetical protein